MDVTETDVLFAVPGGLPHAVKEDGLRLGPYRVNRGHFLLGDFQGCREFLCKLRLSLLKCNCLNTAF